MTCMVSPRMEFDQRIFAVSYLMGESVGPDVVRLLAGAQHVVNVTSSTVHNNVSLSIG